MTARSITKVCSIENCERPMRIVSTGMCQMHYQRVKRYGDINFVKRVAKLDPQCKIPGCEGSPRAKGMCQKHYKRMRKFGDPLIVGQIRNDDEARFWQFVDKTPGLGPNGDCWHWTGCKTREYGQIWIGDSMVNAHRFSYFLKHGSYPLPIGRHKCDNPICVNPDHIEEGTQRDNMQDKISRGRGRNQYGNYI